jgi:hypothetical protein
MAMFIVPRRSFRVEIGGRITDVELIKKMEQERVLFVNPELTARNFPINSHEKEVVEIALIKPGRSFSQPLGRRYLKAAGLKPPTHEQAFRFAEQYARSGVFRETTSIIFLVEPSQQIRCDRWTLCVSASPTVPGICVYYPRTVFTELNFIAGVRTQE